MSLPKLSKQKMMEAVATSVENALSLTGGVMLDAVATGVENALSLTRDEMLGAIAGGDEMLDAITKGVENAVWQMLIDAIAERDETREHWESINRFNREITKQGAEL